MVKAKVTLSAVLALICLGASAQPYYWHRVPMDGHRDHTKGTALLEARHIQSLQPKMKELNEILAVSDVQMSKYRPQSPLGNWAADLLLVQGEKIFGEHIDVSVINAGGIRTDMPKGDITYSDMLGMFPFKNSIAFVRTSGQIIWDLVDKMAKTRFECLGGIKAVVSKNGLESLQIGGKPVEMDRIYNVATLDFLLTGGDDIYLEKGAKEVKVANAEIFSTICSYLRDLTAAGKKVHGEVDDRISFTYETSKSVSADKLAFAGDRRECPKGPWRLTILHTNDTHSTIEPIKAGKYAGMGGIVERAAFIDSVRLADGPSNVLLLDAGDFEQGTPYFKVFGGKAEIEAMNIMKYDAAAMGNHEFDKGLDDLASRLKDAQFTCLLANYTWDHPELSKVVKPYTIVKRGGMKIGIIGVLDNIKQVTVASVAKKIEYALPAETVNRWSSFLKKEKKCDLVIVLSHCGYSSRFGYPGDIEFAKDLHDVDIIVGGHTHTDLLSPTYVKDLDGKEVMVVTDYCKGVYVGMIKI